MKLIIDIPKANYEKMKIMDEKSALENPYLMAIAQGTPLPKEQEPKTDTLDKIKGYIDHIRNTGMGKKKSLEFIEKFIDGLKAEIKEGD